jgi:hypothetical protein
LLSYPVIAPSFFVSASVCSPVLLAVIPQNIPSLLRVDSVGIGGMGFGDERGREIHAPRPGPLLPLVPGLR